MRKHFFYYITLIALLVVGVFLIVELQQQKQSQMIAVVILGVVYAGWGIMHHKMHHSLRARIVLEYIGVAALGIAAILFILRSVL